MGRCWLRASEVSDPGDGHLRYSEDGEVWLFDVRGKNTAGGPGKIRDAWMPDLVADDVHKYSRERRRSRRGTLPGSVGLALADEVKSRRALTSCSSRGVRRKRTHGVRVGVVRDGDTVSYT